MRLLITGSRTWDNRIRIMKKFIDYQEFNERMNPGEVMTLIHGTAEGADSIAEEAAIYLGWEIARYPAQWNVHTEDCPDWHSVLPTCKMAGFRRNRQMIEEANPDRLQAFIRDNSKGATMTVDLARKAGLPTSVLRYEDDFWG